MKAKPVFLFALAAALFVALSGPTTVSSRASSAGETYYLPVFETSDTHGYLVDTSSSDYEYRLAYISDKVKDVRNGRKDRAVLLDGGDIYQGNTVSNLLEGQSLAAAYQLMGYDAVTIGNHEFDWTIEKTVDADATMLDSAIAGYAFANTVPVVSINLKKNGAPVSFARDYVILEKTAVSPSGKEISVRIAVIGFASSYSSSIMTANFAGAGYTIDADTTKLNSLAKQLEESGACDATIVLCHGEATYMASAVGPGSVVDLVLGGHTHQSFFGNTSWGLPYMQPACYGQAYAYTDLAFTVQDGAPKFSGTANTKTVSTLANPAKLYNTPANASELDPEIVALSDASINAISSTLNDTIGYITTSAEKFNAIGGSGDRSTTMGNWMASLASRAVGAEVGFWNAGGVRTEFVIPYGDDRLTITSSDVHTMFPFGNKIYLYDLTYREFLQLLNYAMSSNGSTLFSRMTGIDVYYTGETIRAIIRSDGIPVYADGEFKGSWADEHILVAANEFIATNDRKSFGVSNPLIAWNKTSRLISSDIVDVDGALTVLRDEASRNNGLLTVDPKAHFLSRSLSDPKWTFNPDGTLILESGFRFIAGEPSPWEEIGSRVSRVRIEFGLKAIPEGAFRSCPNLTEILYEGSTDYWSWIEITDSAILNRKDLVITCTDGVIENGSVSEREETIAPSGENSGEAKSDSPEGSEPSSDGYVPRDHSATKAPSGSEGRSESEYVTPESGSDGSRMTRAIAYGSLGILGAAFLAGAVVVLVLRKKNREE